MKFISKLISCLIVICGLGLLFTFTNTSNVFALTNTEKAEAIVLELWNSEKTEADIQKAFDDLSVLPGDTIIPSLGNITVSNATAQLQTQINTFSTYVDPKSDITDNPNLGLTSEICSKFPDSPVCKSDHSFIGTMRIIINALLYMLAIVSVLVLVVAGIRYTFSGGSEKAVTGAKNSILYSVIGLVVALVSYAILNFVISKVSSVPNIDNNLIGVLKTIINILLYILAIASVLVIVIGGIRYSVSAGNEKAVSGAKNTILYAVVGLVVSLLAYAIINFVLTNIK